jgi:hypothetical protein
VAVACYSLPPRDVASLRRHASVRSLPSPFCGIFLHSSIDFDLTWGRARIASAAHNSWIMGARDPEIGGSLMRIRPPAISSDTVMFTGETGKGTCVPKFEVCNLRSNQGNKLPKFQRSAFCRFREQRKPERAATLYMHICHPSITVGRVRP